jgi:large repetitive protein
MDVSGMTSIYSRMILLAALLLTPHSAHAVLSFKAMMNTAYEFVGYGGSGTNGALSVAGTTVYTDNTRTYITTGATAGATTIPVNSNSGFAAGDEIVIMQMRGSGMGNYETKTITSTTATTLSFGSALSYNYTSYSAGSAVAQVVKIPQYSSVSITGGGVLTVNSFDGITGGLMFFRSSGNVAITSGAISVKGKGFAGGGPTAGGQGPQAGGTNTGGGNSTPGSNLQAFMGSGGGGSASDNVGNGDSGGSGGGVMIMKIGGTLTIDGSIDATGGSAGQTNSTGGGGAGGTVIISADTITKSGACGSFNATGGGNGNLGGSAGANGRAFVQYSSSLGCTNVNPASTTTYWKFSVR